MRHPIAKITKRVRELANTAYDADGCLLDEFQELNLGGCYRKVKIEDNVAYKLAYMGCDEHNRHEWNLWEKLPISVRGITAKPLAISNCSNVLAMEYISGGTLRKSYEHLMDIDGQYPDKLHEARDAFNAKLSDLLQQSGKFSTNQIKWMLNDNHASNIAVRANGELCWIDYACID
jgi:hypothetical protein